jgi:hypothetical protein
MGRFHGKLNGETTDAWFHGKLDGETALICHDEEVLELTDRELGFFLGILVGEGHFGGDGRQPQITLRMHVRHESLFHWLRDRIPESRLYGPYHHGGRSYFQWMARGAALREHLLPLLMANLDLFDDHTRQRFLDMCRDYRIKLDELPPKE